VCVFVCVYMSLWGLPLDGDLVSEDTAALRGLLFLSFSWNTLGLGFKFRFEQGTQIGNIYMHLLLILK